MASSFTRAADRTASPKRRAGSRRNKKHKNVGTTCRDRVGAKRIGEGMPLNWRERVANIDHVFPQLGQSHHH